MDLGFLCNLLGCKIWTVFPETNWSGSGKLDLLKSFSSLSICHEWYSCFFDPRHFREVCVVPVPFVFLYLMLRGKMQKKSLRFCWSSLCSMLLVVWNRCSTGGKSTFSEWLQQTTRGICTPESKCRLASSRWSSKPPEVFWFIYSPLQIYLFVWMDSLTT